MPETSPAGAQRLPAPVTMKRGLWRQGLAALMLLWVVCLAPAQAQEWRYRVRPGDTTWDLARKYLRADVPWQRLAEHNRIEDPLRLAPGSMMRLPVAWLRQQPARARVIAVSGHAVASRSGSFDDAVTVTEGLSLGAGAALRTPAGASLTIEFADGSRLQLHADSELHLDRLGAYGATGMVDTRLRLPRGRAMSHVQRSRGPASRYVVEAPDMTSSVRGTGFRVGVDGQRSRSEVVEGIVQVSAGGGDVRVAAGHGTMADTGGRPTAPVPLLPAPDLAGWPARIERIPATLRWPAVAGAMGYRLQASAHEDFRTLLQDSVHDDASAGLDPGAEGPMFLRVRAIDAAGLEGLDATVRVTVAAQPAPPFAIAPVDGADAAGPRPRLRWTRAEGRPLRYRVQVAPASAGFDAPVYAREGIDGTELRIGRDLPPGGYAWRIGATDDRGQPGPWSDPMHFRLHDPGQGPGVETASTDGVLQVRWRSGDDGQRYRFQLSRKPGFERIQLDRVVDANTIDLPGLRAGTWYMRVAAVDSDGYEHAFGPVQVAKVGCMPCRWFGSAGAVLLLLAL